MHTATKAVVMLSAAIGFLFTGLWLALAVVSKVFDEPIVFYFDKYGEHNAEIIILSVILVLMAYSMYKIHRRYRGSH